MSKLEKLARQCGWTEDIGCDPSTFFAGAVKACAHLRYEIKQESLATADELARLRLQGEQMGAMCCAYEVQFKLQRQQADADAGVIMMERAERDRLRRERDDARTDFANAVSLARRERALAEERVKEVEHDLNAAEDRIGDLARELVATRDAAYNALNMAEAREALK